MVVVAFVYGVLRSAVALKYHKLATSLKCAQCHRIKFLISSCSTFCLAHALKKQ